MVEQQFDVIEALYGCGALRKGHFKLSSGLHSDTYVQCSQLLKDPALAMAAGLAIAEAVHFPVDVVVSPALGGVIIGFATAVALRRESLFAERYEGDLALRRGFAIEPGASVLLVEDVITTGGSILELARLVEAAGGEVAGLACIVQRGELAAGCPEVTSLAKVTADTFEPEMCPMCAREMPLDSPGSRFVR